MKRDALFEVENNIFKRIWVVVPYFIAVIICILAAIPVFSNSITQDEAFSVVLVRKNMAEMIKDASADVHPPLYYFLMMLVKGALHGRESLLAYRLLSCAGTCFNLLLIGATMIRKRWGIMTANIYIIFFGLTYYTMEYTVIVRMYTWGTFFVTLASLLALKAYEEEKIKYLVICGFVTLAAMYTHYYALLAVFLVWAFLLVVAAIRKRKLIKGILLTGILIVIGYFPWLGIFIGQTDKVAQNYWIQEYLFGDMIRAPYIMTEIAALPGVGYGFQILVFAMFFLAIIRKKYILIISSAIVVGVLVISSLYSVLVQPIWIARYFYILWGLVSIVVAVVIGEKYSLFSIIPQIAIIILLSFYGYFCVKTIFSEEIMQTNVDEWMYFLDENVDSEAYIMVDDYEERIMMYDYYFPNAHILMLQSMSEEQIADFMQESNDCQLWYLPNYYFSTIGEERMEKIVMDYGYQMLDNNAKICHIQYGSMRIRRVEKVEEDE